MSRECEERGDSAKSDRQNPRTDNKELFFWPSAARNSLVPEELRADTRHAFVASPRPLLSAQVTALELGPEAQDLKSSPLSFVLHWGASCILIRATDTTPPGGGGGGGGGGVQKNTNGFPSYVRANLSSESSSSYGSRGAMASLASKWNKLPRNEKGEYQLIPRNLAEEEDEDEDKSRSSPRSSRKKAAR